MTDAVKINCGNTKMVAHRGLSGLECENTLAAFIAAGNRDYFGIETDVHVTADGGLVVIHDDSTGRVSQTDLPVEGSRFDELRALTLNARDGRPRIDLRIPTLEEYLDVCRRYGKISVLEIKNAFGRTDLERVAEAVKREYSVEGLIFISFCYENLVILRELLPNAKLQFLCGEKVDDALADKLLAHGLDLDIHHSCLDRAAIELLHSRGIAVNCWTVDDPARAEELAGWGVDFITSNILH